MRHGERALALHQSLSPDELAGLKTKLAFSLFASAHGYEAIAMAREAAAHWRASGDDLREAKALNVLIPALSGAGRTALAMEETRRASEILERHPPGPELAAAYSRLGSAHMLARDRDTAVVWGERAIALADELGDVTVLGRALVETGIADVMDLRFESLARIRQGIELDGCTRLPHSWSWLQPDRHRGGELRRYDESPFPALIEAVAIGAENSLEYNRRYAVSWLARCRFDQGHGRRRGARPRCAHGSHSVAIARFVRSTRWAGCARGRGMMSVASCSTRRSTSPRHRPPTAPMARRRRAREAAWIEAANWHHTWHWLERSFDIAGSAVIRRHGRAGVWLRRAGRDVAMPEGVVGPFADWAAGDHLGAAAGFRRMGCPYEAASALADSGDTASLRESLATFERLGAAPAAEAVAAELRRRGVRVAAKRSRDVGETGHLSGLTDRELEVVRLVAGLTNPQIAVRVHQPKTAEPMCQHPRQDRRVVAH